jgi:hypothetical protein
VTTPMHPDDYAAKVVLDGLQAQRDCVDLFAALAEALKRIQLANVTLDVYKQPPIQYRDLLRVLDRTSRAEPIRRSPEPPEEGADGIKRLVDR